LCLAYTAVGIEQFHRAACGPGASGIADPLWLVYLHRVVAFNAFCRWLGFSDDVHDVSVYCLACRCLFVCNAWCGGLSSQLRLVRWDHHPHRNTPAPQRRARMPRTIGSTAARTGLPHSAGRTRVYLSRLFSYRLPAIFHARWRKRLHYILPPRLARLTSFLGWLDETTCVRTSLPSHLPPSTYYRAKRVFGRGFLRLRCIRAARLPFGFKTARRFTSVSLAIRRLLGGGATPRLRIFAYTARLGSSPPVAEWRLLPHLRYLHCSR
jgi:hypothetical protein